MANAITILTTYFTYASGHMVATYIPAKGIHAGTQRTGLLTPAGRPCKSMPAEVTVPVPEPAPAKVTAPAKPEVVIAAQTADAAPVRYVTLADTHGDGGAAGDVEVEVLSSPTPPAPPALQAHPTRKGYAWQEFAGLARKAGLDFAAAGKLWAKCKGKGRTVCEYDIREAADALAAPVARKARKARATKRPSHAPAKRTDVDAVTETRKARKANGAAEAKTLNDRFDHLEALVTMLLG